MACKAYASCSKPGVEGRLPADMNRGGLATQDECFVLTVPDPTGQEPQGVFPHKESPLVRDLMLLLEYDASPECAPCSAFARALSCCQLRNKSCPGFVLLRYRP